MLAEAAHLAPPTSGDPNRLLGGWIPTQVGSRSGYRLSARGARLRFVTLEPKPRSLRIDWLGAVASPPPGLHLRFDRGPPIAVPAASPLSIALPPELAPGAHVVEISRSSPGAADLVLGRARLTGAAAGGHARLDGGDLVQSGWSLVDVVARPAAALLAGELCPGSAIQSAPRFSVEVAAAVDGPAARWSWHGSFWDRLRGCARFELPLPPGPAPLRARFAASGEGAPGRWRRLRWTGGNGELASQDILRAPAPRPARPRLVILYVMDALRADYVGHLGGPGKASPTLDRLAAEGFTFRRHWSVAPNTWPSIRALFTGEIVSEPEAWRRATRGRATLAELYGQAGYRCGLFSGNPYVSKSPRLRQGFDHAAQEAAFRPRRGSARMPNENARQVHAAALDWLRSLPRGSPALLYVHTMHPHSPYAPPEPFLTRATAGLGSGVAGDIATLKRIERGQLIPSAADTARLRALYRGSLAYGDAELARFLAAVSELYPAAETLVAITSDHGEELLDHGGVLHGHTLYEELLHVPLVIWSPGRVRSGESALPTDTLDLHATLVDLAGAQRGPVSPAGRSLLPLAAGGQRELPPRLHFAAAPGARGGIYAVRDGQRKLIWARGTRDDWAMGRGPGRAWDREFYFDLDADPKERANLAGWGGIWEQWLRAALRRWVEEQRAAGGGEVEDPEAALDAETAAQLRALGYLD